MMDDTFEFDAPTTFTNLVEMAKASDDGADKYFDIIAQKMESAKSEPNLAIQNISFTGSEEYLEENKENCVPDEFNDQNINSLAHQLIRSAKKSRTSKLHNRHSITVEGIELELPRVKHHAMITRLDELESTPKIDLRTRSVVKSGYKYEHIKPGSQDNLKLDKSSKKYMSIAEKVRNFFKNTPPRFHSKPTISAGSKVFKPRSNICLFPDAFEQSSKSNNIIPIENKQLKNGNDGNQTLRMNSSHIHSSGVKVPVKSNIKVLNSHGGVQVVENKDLGHGGVKVQEKQLHTVPKPFSFESRKSCAVKTQSMKANEQPWVFKARPATVLQKKPFIPKHEKKYTEPKNMRLNTERRAKEWMVFEQEIKEKFSHYEEMLRLRQEENHKREMDLIKNMRQKTIHKAEPIKKYKPVLIRKSMRPVTVPQSPRFSVRPIRNCLNSVCE